jgi:hypothetical protein
MRFANFVNFGNPDIAERLHQLSKADVELIRRVIEEYGMPLADMAPSSRKDRKTVKDLLVS